MLRQCGDDLTRENIMKQPANLKDFRNRGLLQGSLINTSPTDYRVVKYMTLERLNGKSWEAAGRIGWRGHSCFGFSFTSPPSASAGPACGLGSRAST